MQFEPVKTIAIEVSGTTAVIVESKTANIVLEASAPGPQGKPGKDGVDGLPGRDGTDGAPGAPGRDGADGVDGLSGRDGVDGAPGLPGSIGPQGERGLQGNAGANADPAVTTAISNRVDALTSTVTAIRNLAPEVLDTFNEVAAAINNDPQFAATMTTALAHRVRYDAAQTLTASQRAVGRSNIDAAGMSDVTARLSRDAYVRTFQALTFGKPPANVIVGGGILPQAGTVDVSSSMFRAEVAPTSNAVLSITVNGLARGTITYAAGSNIAVIAMTNGQLNAADYLIINAPPTADNTLSGIVGGLVVRL